MDDISLVEEHVLEGKSIGQVTVEELRAAYRKFSLKYRDAFINQPSDLVTRVNAAYDRVKRNLPEYQKAVPAGSLSYILTILGTGVLINLGSAAIYSLIQKSFQE